MIDRNRLKLAIASALLLAVSLVALGTLGWTAGLHRALLSGASPADVFTPVPPVPVGIDPVVTWRDDPPTPRMVEPATRTAIEEAWVGALGRLDAALRDGDPTDLVTSFSGAGLEQVTAALAQTVGVDRQLPLAHDLEINFYSDDGSIVGLLDHGARIVRVAGNQVVESTEAWSVILLLRDGRWRVEHLVREAATPVAVTPAQDVDVRWAGINYEPRDTPWSAQWTSFDEEIAEADLGLVVGLGLDTIRVFLPYAELGGADPSPAMLDRVTTLLDLAHERGVGVVLTLFDEWPTRSLESWPAADRHIASIVPVLGGHPAVVAWDLKNQPDLDDAAEGRALVRGWLRHVAAEVRRHDPATPITIGWSSPKAAQDLIDVVDVVSFHHYGTPDDLREAMPELVAAAKGRPLVLGEFGLPTWNTFLPGGHGEAEQAAWYADILALVREFGVDGTLAWTLHDVAQPPPGASRSPRRHGWETNLGVLRRDGTPKLAAAVIAPGADLAAVPRPGWIELRLAKRWWQGLLLAGLSLLALAAAYVGRAGTRTRDA